MGISWDCMREQINTAIINVLVASYNYKNCPNRVQSLHVARRERARCETIQQTDCLEVTPAKQSAARHR